MAADAQSGFEHQRKPIRCDEFLKTMEALVPWSALCEETAPNYPKVGNGRPSLLRCNGTLRVPFVCSQLGHQPCRCSSL
jgi:hypothetical protein